MTFSRRATRHDRTLMGWAPHLALGLLTLGLLWACSTSTRSRSSADWGTAERVDSSDLGSVSGLAAELDSTGNVLVVWQQSSGVQRDLWSARYLRNSGWTSPALIETDDSGDVRSPELSVDADGNVLAVWRQSDGTRFNQWANRFSMTSGWGVAEKIETNDLGDTQARSLINSDVNEWTAVWRQWDGVRYNQWANTYLAGSGWGVAEMIDTEDLGDVFDPILEVSDDGVTCALWRQYDGTRWNLWASRHRPDAGWDVAEKIETEDGGDVNNPVAGVDPDGYFTVAWTQDDGTRTNLWSNRLNPMGTWEGAARIETDDSGNVSAPALVVDGEGDVTVLWGQSDGTRLNLYSQRREFASGWQGAELREAEDLGSVGGWDLSVDSSDNVLALWTQNDGSVDNLWSARFRPGVGWSTAEKIESEDAGDAIFNDRGVFDSSGRFTYAFQIFDGTRRNLWVNRFVPATGWEGAILLETEDGGDTRDPELVEHRGVVTVVWRQDSGTVFDQWAAQFDPDDADRSFQAGWTTNDRIEAEDGGSAEARILVIDAAGRVTALWPQSNGTFNQLFSNRLE